LTASLELTVTELVAPQRQASVCVERSELVAPQRQASTCVERSELVAKQRQASACVDRSELARHISVAHNRLCARDRCSNRKRHCSARQYVHVTSLYRGTETLQ
jgi:hypothetical protein